MFSSKNKKNNVYPCQPQFYYIKVGFKGVKIILACFRDAISFLVINISFYFFHAGFSLGHRGKLVPGYRIAV